MEFLVCQCLDLCIFKYSSNETSILIWISAKIICYLPIFAPFCSLFILTCYYYLCRKFYLSKFLKTFQYCATFPIKRDRSFQLLVLQHAITIPLLWYHSTLVPFNSVQPETRDDNQNRIQFVIALWKIRCIIITQSFFRNTTLDNLLVTDIV